VTVAAAVDLAAAVPVGVTGRPVYQLKGVSKRFARRDVLALDRVDLTLHEGSFSSIIGPSGCGKSTMLKIMAGVLPPSRAASSWPGRTSPARAARSG
jgi:NitT/TauT family transport system ATP-binding protein